MWICTQFYLCFVINTITIRVIISIIQPWIQVPMHLFSVRHAVFICIRIVRVGFIRLQGAVCIDILLFV